MNLDIRLAVCPVLVATLIAALGSPAAAQIQATPEILVVGAEPSELTMFPDQKSVLAIFGKGLDRAQSVQAVRAKDGKTITKHITGELDCDRGGERCDVSIVTSRDVKPDLYQLMLRADREVVGVLPVELTVVAGKALVVSVVDPEKIAIEAGDRASLKIGGANLGLAKNARAVRIEKGRLVGGNIALRLACARSGRSCEIAITATRDAKPGEYRIALRADKTTLATLPFLLVITPSSEETPDRVITIDGEPGVTVQRSCEEGADDTTVQLLAPEAGAGLNATTELVWARTEHEVCGGFGTEKRYLFAICGNPNDDPCSPANGIWFAIQMSPNFLGAGRCVIEPEAPLDGDDADEDIDCVISQDDLDDIAQEAGVDQGDTVYWQVAYSYEAGGTQRVWTAKRPLAFLVEDEPEPDPDPGPDPAPGGPPAPILFAPANGSAMHATNRTFAWSDNSPPNTPNDPNFPDWTWRVCLMRPPSTVCQPNGEIERISDSLSGLAFYDFQDFGLAGGEIRWKVRACDEAGQCGGYSQTFTAYMPLAPAERVYPVHRAEVDPPRTFAWREVEGADFYWLVMSHSYGGGAGSRFLTREVAGATSVFLSAQELAVLDRPGGGANEHFGTVSGWHVRACYDPDGAAGPVDPVCSDPSFATYETLGDSFVTFTNNPVDPGEVTFDAIKDAFKTSSCVTCHTIVPTNSMPPGHPGLTVPAGQTFQQFVGNSANCVSCHTNGLLPITPGQQGTLAISWHAVGAPKSVDLRSLNDDELCEVAKSHPPGAAAANPADHLANDPLVLWSVVGGPLPPGAPPPGTGEQAFPGTLQEWRELVANFTEDSPCEKPF